MRLGSLPKVQLPHWIAAGLLLWNRSQRVEVESYASRTYLQRILPVEKCFSYHPHGLYASLASIALENVCIASSRRPNDSGKKSRYCSHGTMCPYCCWLWQAGRSTEGYGLFTVKLHGHKTRVAAQRIAWELVNNRSFPEKLWGLHHCDMPACCNPWHVYPGTPRHNQLDVIRRHRQQARIIQREARKNKGRSQQQVNTRRPGLLQSHASARTFSVKQFLWPALGPWLVEAVNIVVVPV